MYKAAAQGCGSGLNGAEIRYTGDCKKDTELMTKYGIPYQGSKSAIAEDIIAALPSGNRLVDLFGGGFAISECALLSYKWKSGLKSDRMLTIR